MTKEERRERREANKARDERARQVREAMIDERDRFNAKVLTGTVAILQTAFGPFQVTSVNQDFWFSSHPAGQTRSEWNRRSFAGCNNGSWADLLRQVGEARHPLFGREVS